ncbi:DNA-binding protein [Paraburkholderia graminis]|uniref:DNA repair exonuclease SbcCD ATPase subunit n=1 Tax=Paraburkholderia graminis TaxID=60548 RepID=A0ABD5CNE1_9BURK|nr:DNA-binding protein [Paraburkholderia graminis]MDR6206578.1 DNA repair exonuclease SbcCD ATPase subunit [Paraburkholderia graminis]
MSMETDIVTDERVAQIADRMAGEGKKVSALAIWGELRCGSIVAVSAAVERWRQARQPASAEAPASVMTGLPDDVAQTMLSAAGNLWASAREEAERVVNQRLALAGGHADALAAERDEALAEYQNTLAEAELARERVATLTNALSISEEAVNRLATELSALRDRAKTAEDRVAELEDRAAAAEARVAQTEEREAASEARVGEAEERALAAEARIAEADERASAAEARVVQTEERALAAEARIAEAEERASTAEARVAQTEERASAAEERATETDERVRDAEGRVAHAEERASTAEARLAEAEQHASAVQARLEAAETSLTEERGAREALNAATVARDEEIARLIAERDAAHEKAAALGEAGEAHAREVQRWTDESNAASSRAQDAALQASESLAQLAALQTELDKARAELAAERDAHAAHGDEAAAQRAEVERVQHELAAAREQLAAMSEANAAATAETTRLAQDASAATSRAQAAEQRVAELARQLAELETAHAQQQGASPEGLSADDESKEAVMADEIASLRRQMTSQAKAHEKAYAELRTLAEQWIAHAKELKQRLSATNQKVTFLDARSAAEVALLRRLSSELERLKPDHDLISRDAQQKFISATLAERLEQKGYRYDPATAVMSKIEADRLTD